MQKTASSTVADRYYCGPPEQGRFLTATGSGREAFYVASPRSTHHRYVEKLLFLGAPRAEFERAACTSNSVVPAH